MGKHYLIKIKGENMHRIISICIGLLLSICVKSQDFHLSQYDASPLYLNPSLTGLFDGEYRVHTHYRNQWSSITSPFTTTSIGFDMPVKKIGIGGIILNDRAGSGNYNVLNFLSSFSYDHSIGKLNDHHIGIGIQLGFIHKSLLINDIYFPNQYEYTSTNGFNSNLPSGENIANTSFFLPEIAISILYYYSKNESSAHPFVGCSVFHLTEPTETFYSNNNQLPRRVVVHTGVKFNIGNSIQITPKLMTMTQGNANESNVGLLASYFIRQENTWVFIGTNYRIFKMNNLESNDAMVVQFGVKHKNLTYRISYDNNISSLSSVSNGNGAFELSVTYIKNKKTLQKPTICPKL